MFFLSVWTNNIFVSRYCSFTTFKLLNLIIINKTVVAPSRRAIYWPATRGYWYYYYLKCLMIQLQQMSTTNTMQFVVKVNKCKSGHALRKSLEWRRWLSWKKKITHIFRVHNHRVWNAMVMDAKNVGNTSYLN